MDFVWFCVTWVIGIIAGAFFLIQPLIVIFFAIPFSMKLKSRGIMNGSGPLPMYIGSAIGLSCIFAAITYGIHAWLAKQMLGYWIGVGLTLLNGLRKIGANQTNVQEFIEMNSRFLDMERVEAELGITLQARQ